MRKLETTVREYHWGSRTSHSGNAAEVTGDGEAFWATTNLNGL